MANGRHGTVEFEFWFQNLAKQSTRDAKRKLREEQGEAHHIDVVGIPQ